MKKKKDGGQKDDMQAEQSVRVQGPMPFVRVQPERVKALERKVYGDRKGK